MKLATCLHKMRHLSPQAALILRLGLGLCCYLLLCAAVLLLRGWPCSLDSYAFFLRAARLQHATLCVFFCTAFLASFVEEHNIKS